MGGVIVTLLLAIVIGIYVKTENEVEIHIKQNYGKYEQQIKTDVAESKQQLAKLTFFVSMAEKFFKSMQNNQNTPQSPTTSESDETHESPNI